MTPAEELRQAAAKVREKGDPLTKAGAENLWTEWRGFFTLHGADLGLVREDEEWIALMSPAVAEPLAAWLELTAEHWRPERDLPKHYPARHAMQQQAMTLAQLVNGTAS